MNDVSNDRSTASGSTTECKDGDAWNIDDSYASECEGALRLYCGVRSDGVVGEGGTDIDRDRSSGSCSGSCSGSGCCSSLDKSEIEIVVVESEM